MSRRPLPKALRDRVKASYGGRCAYCGVKADRLQVDHYVPVERGPLISRDFDVNQESNLKPACFSCNNYKHAFMPEEFRKELQRQVQRAREHSLNFRLAERFGLITINDVTVRFYFEDHGTE